MSAPCFSAGEFVHDIASIAPQWKPRDLVLPLGLCTKNYAVRLERRHMTEAPDIDWSREAKRFFEWAPSRSLLASIRSYQRHSGRGPLSGLLRKWAVLRHRFWSVATGADIPINTRLGGGLLIPHPNGIVIHPDVTVGTNCLILQQVTLGHGRGGVPTIGAGVDIGAGAKVLGGLHVGDYAAIAAMAVVTRDVPERSLVMGIPARVVRQAEPGRHPYERMGTQ